MAVNGQKLYEPRASLLTFDGTIGENELGVVEGGGSTACSHHLSRYKEGSLKY